MSEHHLKWLMLLRHAKADWPRDVADHERPLTSRGHRDAAAAGRWLLENGTLPDFILCSSALRARQTCTWVCQELGDKAPTAKLEDRLYEAPPARILSLINHVPATVTSLLVVAHMPGVQDLAMRLASVDSDEEPVLGLATDYPTTGLTVMEYDGDWPALDGRDARVRAFAAPRG
jgi:phosphohistidine phosphatase